MKVIKVVNKRDGKLVSTFAADEWRKEYAKGVETKPNIGYLFAYSIKNMKGAKANFGGHGEQYWLAEAEVVGRVHGGSIAVEEATWLRFWGGRRLQTRLPGATYLLCSSITLIKKLKRSS